MRLGVNIDHIAYLRETRKINDPDPLEAIFIAKRSGASQITVHLREDRRHICEYDLSRIIESSFLPINVECSTNANIIKVVCELKPHRITIVPENRNEVTTEGGLLLQDSLLPVMERILHSDIDVALFIDPNEASIEKCLKFGEKLGLISKKSSKSSEMINTLSRSLGVELHTGKYANLSLMIESNLSRTHNSIKELELSRSKLASLLSFELNSLIYQSKQASNEGLLVFAGHGLNYHNVKPITNISYIEELNIGQSIIARSIFTGLENAIKDMIKIIKRD
ncbi:pyridoxine 5'-phosphate synthase [Helicobacter muridarum]|uniref:Pyridoxine 5'-phosphate synthase n=1 Tax=Helicobacter muridarum TaxID=216 RepID=A0A099TYQ1_9HELI|nr:pyridoxine 5'-phosphate synthase [Helicobacter muridarum]TLE01618.1 pyridoxine 5'-phosphate synthase [Helicobacter muridarum]STQ86235.1 pyridoxal phosphate biosynthetic protein [Helicobacter muridarum]